MLNNLLSVFPSFKKAALKKELKDFLNDIINQINKISLIENPLERIISFFNLLSIYHDNINDFNKYSKIFSEEDLSLLKGKIAYMGRCSSGMNRTSKGEIVTEHNVWLGNVYGLVTKPISEWEKSKESQPGCWGFEYIYGVKSEQLNPYNVVCLQAKNYVTDNTLLLVQICTDIIDNLEK